MSTLEVSLISNSRGPSYSSLEREMRNATYPGSLPGASMQPADQGILKGCCFRRRDFKFGTEDEKKFMDVLHSREKMIINMLISFAGSALGAFTVVRHLVDNSTAPHPLDTSCSLDLFEGLMSFFLGSNGVMVLITLVSVKKFVSHASDSRKAACRDWVPVIGLALVGLTLIASGGNGVCDVFGNAEDSQRFQDEFLLNTTVSGRNCTYATLIHLGPGEGPSNESLYARIAQTCRLAGYSQAAYVDWTMVALALPQVFTFTSTTSVRSLTPFIVLTCGTLCLSVGMYLHLGINRNGSITAALRCSPSLMFDFVMYGVQLVVTTVGVAFGLLLAFASSEAAFRKLYEKAKQVNARIDVLWLRQDPLQNIQAALEYLRNLSTMNPEEFPRLPDTAITIGSQIGNSSVNNAKFGSRSVVAKGFPKIVGMHGANMEAAIEELVREMATLCKLTTQEGATEHCVQCYGLWVDQKHNSGPMIYIVTESIPMNCLQFCKKKWADLSKKSETARQIGWMTDTKDILVKIKAGMCFLHDNGFTHLDLTLEKVLRDPDTHRTVLCDFGVSERIHKVTTSLSSHTPSYFLETKRDEPPGTLTQKQTDP